MICGIISVMLHLVVYLMRLKYTLDDEMLEEFVTEIKNDSKD